MKIFLSAVTGELGRYREELTRPLLRKTEEVRVQEYFRPGTATLLEKIRDYVRECDLVVLLIGERSGAFPTENEKKVVGAIDEFARYSAHTGQTHASYTQWELFFALQYGRRIHVFVTGDDFKPDKPNDESPESRACQKAYRGWIKHLGLDRNKLTTVEKLIEDILVGDFGVDSSPRPNNLPYHSLLDLFKGRETFLVQLKASLVRTEAGHATAIVQSAAVHGLGGVGKTRLAVEYGWRHATEYSALLFVTADSPENLRRNLAALAAPAVLNLPEHDLPSEEVREAAALHWLEAHPGWFLILDNVDTPEAAEAVEKILARLRHGHVLITARLREWSAGIKPLSLDFLALKDSEEFLLARTDKQRRKTATDAADATKLAKDLDGLALALEQAGAYIAHRSCSIADYLKQWQAHDASVQEWFDARVMKYPRSLAVTWETTLAQLGLGEVALLRLFSWFTPDPIPLFVLDGENNELTWQVSAALFADELGIKEFGHGKPQGEALSELVSNARPRDAMVNLVNYGMAGFGEDDCVVVHRVVQEILRNRIPKTRCKEWVQQAAWLLILAAPREPYDVRTWPQWNPLRPHIAACAAVADAEEISKPTAGLMAGLGAFLLVKALYDEAEPLMRRSLVLTEKNSGPDHPDISSPLTNLASLLSETNRVAEAEPLVRRALAIDEKHLGVEHPFVAASLNCLGQLLHETNRFTEAEPVMRRVLSIEEKTFGPDHPKVAIPLNNLARLLYVTGRLAEAEPLYLRALAIDEKNYGPHHPNVARCLNNLAQVLQDTNRLAEAELLMRRVMVIDEHYFGSIHPQVARDLNNLAQLLVETKRPSEAEPLMRRTLAIDEHFYDSTHPNVARSLHNLAEFLREAGRYSEAEPLFRRWLIIAEKNLGAHDPEVANRLGCLSQVLKEMKHFAVAEPLMRRALDIAQQNFGKRHSKVAFRLNNLASLLLATNRHREAESLMRLALEILVQCQGLMHPDSQSISKNYLAVLMHTGLSPYQAAKAVEEVMAAAARGA